VPTPPVPEFEIARRFAAYKAALAEGHRPIGIPGKGPNAVTIAANKLGIDVHGIRRAVEQSQDGLIKTKLSDADTIRDLRAQLLDARRDEITDEKVRETIFGLATASPDIPKWTMMIDKSTHGSSGVPMSLWSDWHWSEVVDPAGASGNKYDLKIAHHRARRLVEKIISLCFNHMTTPKYPGIVVALGGDMFSGDIHEELSITNEVPTFPALVDLFGVLIWAIEKLADSFGNVFLPCVTGNHGRTTRKPMAKRRAHTNLDWLLYVFLEKHFEKDKRVQFLIPNDTDAHFNVAGHRYLLTHGDNIGTKGGDGMIGALGPILRGDFKVRTASSAVGQPYDTILMGHWHQYTPLRRIIVNGSLKGYDEWSKAMRFSPEAPTQALWFTHTHHGITCHWPVFVGETEKSPEAEWVSWRKEK
jgi:predicted phosphodiesterase